MSHDHTTWIDEQRAAGMARGNVFSDILSAAHVRRQQLGFTTDAVIERRQDRIKAMKASAAAHDGASERESGLRGTPTFAELSAHHDTVSAAQDAA